MDLLQPFYNAYEGQNAFTWDKEVLPFAKDHWLVTGPALYVAGVFLIKSITPEGGVPLGPLPILHNAILVLWCAGSELLRIALTRVYLSRMIWAEAFIGGRHT